MAEHRIEVTIDPEGKITAKSDGIKGPVCLDKIQELLGDLADLESFDKTDEWFQTIENENTISRSETIRRG